MGITQQIGASSLIKPGVIDNTAARPASPFEGQVIFQKDTDQLLVWNGTAWVIPNSPAQNPMGLELVIDASFTAQTSVPVTGCFTSTYKNYRVIIHIESASTQTTRNITFRFKDSGGDDSTANYYYGSNLDDFGAATPQRQGAYAATSSILAPYYGYGDSTSTTSIDVYNPQVSTSKSAYIGTAIGGNAGSACLGSVALGYMTAKSHTGFTFFSSTGTITGNYYVYGYRD